MECPKCGANAGEPIYRKSGCAEWLEYLCRCGYLFDGPTKGADITAFNSVREQRSRDTFSPRPPRPRQI